MVSDKSNAFNKIFNLFLCKIFDEDREDDEMLDFQWQSDDTPHKLLGRLNSLYKEGMHRYLKKDITDYTEKDIEQYNSPEIKKVFNELRLYKNQEFAFIEVFNEESFNENAEIVKEVVKLLQQWKIRYTHKQQFLGEFFELLLNTGFKQEAGQFFSPVPLVRFIMHCLPISSLINQRIKDGESDFLPYIIDYACGSGHFLTEAMDVLQQKVLPNIDENSLTPTQRKKYKHYMQGDFEWAERFVYGIERDYRLSKVTKLACFLHGDGEAKIIHASGIAPFNNSRYEGLLNNNQKNNPVFDILITNPPYSIDGFRSTVEDGDSVEKPFRLTPLAGVLATRMIGAHMYGW